MLERVQIRNFQGHGLLDVKLDAGVNTIVGPSDAGKSSFIRSIIWVIENKPVGEAYRKDGTKKTVVQLTIDGQRIKRTRSNTLNTYRLNKKLLKAMGTDVPEKIRELVNMAEINYQAQHDGAFWFCKTAGEVARQLNKIVNLDIIDRTHANIQSQQRENNADLRVHRQTKEELEEKIGEYDYLPEYKKALDEMVAYVSFWRHTELETMGLVALTREARAAKSIIKTNQRWVDYGTEALERLDKLKRTEKRVESLDALIKTAEIFEMQLSMAPPDFLPVEQAHITWAQTYAQFKELTRLLFQISEKEKFICQEKQKLQKLKRKLSAILKTRCPLCGSRTSTK